MKEFVIKQKEKDTFEITYVSSEEISAEKENEIKASIEKYLEKGLTLQLNRVDVLKRKKSGKLKQFESLI